MRCGKFADAYLTGKLNLSSTTASDEATVLSQTLVEVDAVLQGALNVVQDVIGGTAKKEAQLIVEENASENRRGNVTEERSWQWRSPP